MENTESFVYFLIRLLIRVAVMAVMVKLTLDGVFGMTEVEIWECLPAGYILALNGRDF